MKYADDTVVIGLIKSDDNEYQRCIQYVNNWCKANFLDLNVKKTKEVVYDFRRNPNTRSGIMINDINVETTDVYKYLGLWIDNGLTFKEHINRQIKKVQKKLYGVRAMSKLSVSPDLIAMFYNATVPSTLMYASPGFYGLLSQQQQQVLDKPRRMCNKTIRRRGGSDTTLVVGSDFYWNRVMSLQQKIRSDPKHPLYKQYVLLPSGRQWRLPKTRTTRFQKTFVYISLRALNK